MSGTSRVTFSAHEKVCLQELILKYKLNSVRTIGAGNPATKKMAWARLTQEFNSIETNSKRTEAQLRKCWDNLKTRRKQVLAQEKRERMRTGGGLCPTTSQSTTEDIDAALLDATDIELQGVWDSDVDMVVVVDAGAASVPVAPAAAAAASVPVAPAAAAAASVPVAPAAAAAASVPVAPAAAATASVPVAPAAAATASVPVAPAATAATSLNEGISQESMVLVVDNTAGSSNHAPSQIQEPVVNEVEEACRRHSAGSRLSGRETPAQTTVPRNIRAHVINEEFSIRKEKYELERDRDLELYRLKRLEREWLAKAAEEVFNKARIEREIAEELLLSAKANRELAQLNLTITKNKK